MLSQVLPQGLPNLNSSPKQLRCRWELTRFAESVTQVIERISLILAVMNRLRKR